MYRVRQPYSRMKKSNKEDFVTKAVAIHGVRYGYDSFVYVNSKTKGKILCPIHGAFKMSPNAHLNGQGCPKCAKEFTTGRRRALVWGVGINDIERGKCLEPAAQTWYGMLMRCYSSKYTAKYKTYQQCTVSEEWHKLSNFKRWFDDPANGYREGYQLDKDILVKGNKLYSPETCCFVPNEINSLIVKPSRKTRHLLGVFPSDDKFRVIMNKNNRLICIGRYDTEDDAFAVYKNEKEKHIKFMAQKYFELGMITARVRDALFNYVIEKND